MKIQGDAIVYVSWHRCVDGTVKALSQPGMEDKVLLVLGGGLTVSLPVEYARSLAEDMLDALAKIEVADRHRKLDADTADKQIVKRILGV